MPIKKMYVIDENNQSLIDLVINAKKGDEASISMVIDRMQALLKKCAKDNNTWKFGNGLDYDDLVQIGKSAVVKAIKMYNPEFQKTFSTYARTWIQAYMSYAIYYNSATIRVPLLRARKIKNMLKDIDAMDIEELATKHKVSVKKARKMMVTGLSTVSLQQELGDGEGNIEANLKLERFASTGLEESPDEIVMKFERLTAFKKCLSNLTVKERHIIESFYGINGEDKSTLIELGKKYNCTSQNLYAMKSRIVKKLQNIFEEEYKSRDFTF